jgi:serine/threonine-protein kinase RsbW
MSYWNGLSIHALVTRIIQTVRMFKAFAIPGDREQIPRARSEILGFLEEQGCPEETCFEIGMALQEALANAIVHGCKQNAALMANVQVETNSSGATIVVRDPGTGFDVAEVRDPASSEGLEAPSGRGITMMRAYMDDVTFARGGSEVRMHKQWKAAQGA